MECWNVGMLECRKFFSTPTLQYSIPFLRVGEVVACGVCDFISEGRS